MYSIIHAVLLSELPFPEADRLVAISEAWADGISPTSYPDYLDWKAAQHSFDEIAVSRRDDFNMTDNGEPERFSGLFVTASYFRVLKVPPKLGRTFFDEEDSEAGVNPIILSEHLWRSRFAADPTIVGRKLTFNTISYEVVGKAAENLSIVRIPRPLAIRKSSAMPTFTRHSVSMRIDRTCMIAIADLDLMVCRLKQGVSIEQAAADLKVNARNLELKYPASNTGVGIAVTSLRDSVIGKYGPCCGCSRLRSRWSFSSRALTSPACPRSHRYKRERNRNARSPGCKPGKINHATAYRKCSPRIVRRHPWLLARFLEQRCNRVFVSS